MPRNSEDIPVQFYATIEVKAMIDAIPKNQRSKFINSCIMRAVAEPKLHSPQLRIAALEERVDTLRLEVSELKETLTNLCRRQYAKS